VLTGETLHNTEETATEVLEKTVPAEWIICDKWLQSHKTDEIMAVLSSSSAAAGTTGYSSKN
jgi:hypothetical protein